MRPWTLVYLLTFSTRIKTKRCKKNRRFPLPFVSPSFFLDVSPINKSLKKTSWLCSGRITLVSCWGSPGACKTITASDAVLRSSLSYFDQPWMRGGVYLRPIRSKQDCRVIHLRCLAGSTKVRNQRTKKPVRMGNSPSSSNPLGNFRQPPSTEKNVEQLWTNNEETLLIY